MGDDHRRVDPPQGGSDPETLRRRIESCRPYLLTVAAREFPAGLRAKAGVSDFVQETFLEAYGHLDRLRGQTENQVRAWLRQILRHNLANFIRRYRRTGKRRVGKEVSLDRESPSGRKPHDVASVTPSPSKHAMLNEQTLALVAAMSRLKERDRQVLIWRHQDDCSFKEIGERLEGTEEMARKAWVRAVQRLRAMLDTHPNPSTRSRSCV